VLKKNENKIYSSPDYTVYFVSDIAAAPAQNHLKFTASKMKIGEQCAAVSAYKLQHVDKSI